MRYVQIINFFEYLLGHAAKHSLALRFAVLFIAVVYPYLCYLGGFPAMDEGFYAWCSITYNHNLAHSQALAPLQGLALWPLLLAWIPDLPGLSILWFRLADMLAALLAGWLFCKILEKECGAFSNALALVVLICLTNHNVIDNGFKNSFFPAWICFFGAICLLFVKKTKPGIKIWFLVGALISFGILLRETFFPFAFLGLVAAWRIDSWKGAFYYSLGGIITAFLTFACIEWLAPGSLSTVYKGYTDRVAVYQAQYWRIFPNFISYGSRSLLLFSPALLLFLTSFLWWKNFKSYPNNSLDRWEIAFWLCVAFLPLYETVVKLSFCYHFAVCLPGFAFLAAMFTGQTQNNLTQAVQRKKRISILLLLLGFFSIAASIATLPNFTTLKQTLEVLNNFPERRWPVELTPQSTTLQAVAQINEALPNGGTVSMNGMAFFILTAGGFTPPLSGSFDKDDNYFLSDLGRFFLNIKGDKERLKKTLLANPPDIIVLMRPKGKHEPTFSAELTEVLHDTSQYEKIAVIDPELPENKATDYALFGYELYLHQPPT